ncbi:unnamed protein product, partial [Lymnaea stagnalis]
MLSCCTKKVHPVGKGELTDEHKRLIKTVWSDLREQIGEVGMESFLRFFNTHPEAQDSFLVFKDIPREELSQSIKLKEHGLKVTSVVDRCVNRLDDPNAMKNIATQLGKYHERGLLLKYQTALRDSYIDAIKMRSTIVWNSKCQEAWITFFDKFQKELAEASC